MATLNIGPLSRIVDVQWASSLFAVIEMYTRVSNTTSGTLTAPVGNAIECPLPAFDVHPVRFSPDTGAAPWVFPPTDLMVRAYDAWAEDQLVVRRPPFGDDTINVFVINLGRIAKATKNPIVIFELDGKFTTVGRLTYTITCRLFNHVKWKKNIVGELVGIDLIAPPQGPAITQQGGQKGPVFSTSITRNDELTSAQMLDANEPQRFFTITINRAKKNATISPFL